MTLFFVQDPYFKNYNILNRILTRIPTRVTKSTPLKLIFRLFKPQSEFRVLDLTDLKLSTV